MNPPKFGFIITWSARNFARGPSKPYGHVTDKETKTAHGAAEDGSPQMKKKTPTRWRPTGKPIFFLHSLLVLFIIIVANTVLTTNKHILLLQLSTEISMCNPDLPRFHLLRTNPNIRRII